MATATLEVIKFEYKGKDKRGKVIAGEISARNDSLAKAELRKQGINPISVKKQRATKGRGKSIKAGDIAIFTRQIATMLESGVPIVQALEIIGSGQANARMTAMIGDLKKEVESGSAFSEALKRHPTLFDELYINLVESGEQAGVLDQVLADLADYKERVEAIKSKIKKALFYPIAVLAVAVIVSVILLLFVVPTFEELFQDFGADLPAFTQMVINLSEWLQANIGLTLLVIISIAVAFIQAKKRSYKFNHFMDRVSLKIPVLGKVLREAAIARFARTLATTFAAGVPLVDALDTVSGATGNIVFGEAVKKIRDDVAVGHQLQLAMAQTGVFPNMVVQMTAIGEESGALDKMLIKVAEYYEQEVNAAVDSLSSLMEPFIMVIIGGIVGSLVVAMYLPIFKLGAVV